MIAPWGFDDSLDDDMAVDIDASTVDATTDAVQTVIHKVFSSRCSTIGMLYLET